MRPRRLIGRSIRHHWRPNLVVLAGCAVATAVLVGSLTVGESVDRSLEAIAERRVGNVGFAIQGRFLGEELATRLAGDLHTPAAAVLQLEGVVATADGAAISGQVQLLGIGGDLAELLPGEGCRPPDDTSILLNRTLASRLGVAVGDEVLVRVAIPAAASHETPLARDARPAAGMRLLVADIVEAEEGGAFHLRAEQRVPLTAFVSLDALQRRINRERQVNLILLGAHPDLTAGDVAASLRRHWRLADAGLRLHRVAGGELQLDSDRIFLADELVQGAVSAAPPSAQILGYLANELRSGQRAEPYAFVAAVGDERGDSPVFPGLRDDEIALDAWVAEGIGATIGDEVEMAWWAVESGRAFTEQRRSFVVRAVLPLEGYAIDRDLAPGLPGLTDAGSCSDWDPGVPIDVERIASRDEAYWDLHGAAPRAFVTLDAGQALWRNRFGGATAVRYGAGTDATALEQTLLEALAPGDVGVAIVDVRRQAAAGVAQATDFGALVLGFGFFLLAASLLLVGLLFSLAVHQRRETIGTLLALGFSRGAVVRLLAVEGAILATAGAAPGALAGIGYGAALVRLIEAVWPAPAGLSDLGVHWTIATVALGAGAGVATAVLVIAATAWRLVHAAPRHLLAPRVSTRRSPTLRWSVKARGRAPGLGWLALRNTIRRPGRAAAVTAMVALASFKVVAVESFRLDPAQYAALRSSGTGGFALWAETSSPIARDLREADHLAELGLEQAISVVPLRVRRGDDASCLNLNRAQQPRVMGVPAGELARRSAFSFTRAGMGETGWASLDADLEDGLVPAVADQNTLQWALGLAVGDTLVLRDGRGREVPVRFVASLQRSVLQGSVLISEAHFLRLFPESGGFGALLVDVPRGPPLPVARELSAALRDHGPEIGTTVERLGAFHAVENTYLSLFQILSGLALLLGSAGLGIVLARAVVERRGELGMLRALGFQRSRLRALLLLEHVVVLAAGIVIGLGAAAAIVAPLHLTAGRAIPWTPFAATAGAIGLGGCIWIALAATIALRGNLAATLKADR